MYIIITSGCRHARLPKGLECFSREYVGVPMEWVSACDLIRRVGGLLRTQAMGGFELQLVFTVEMFFFCFGTDHALVSRAC